MHDHPSIAGDDADGGHRLEAPLLMGELQGDIACQADVYPVVVLLDTNGEVSRPRELSPRPLAEPSVTLAIHTAPIAQACAYHRRQRTNRDDSRFAKRDPHSRLRRP